MNTIAARHRPTYHLMPPKGWVNDPNGPLYFDGMYHLFYQHNPTGNHWGNLHWGHARSSDLVNWEHLPLAIGPSVEWGETHCFSGCAVIKDGLPRLVYTSIFGQDGNQRHDALQRIATSSDGMLTWQKQEKPILAQSVHTERVMEWRDPFIWQENNVWNMLVGGALDGYGAIFLYRSTDLLDWNYVGPMLVDESMPFLECPNLLRFGEKSVLIYSPNAEVVYRVGTIAPDGRFLTETQGIMDYSGRQGFYAPNTLLNDPKGRYLTWGWITEEARGGYSIDGYNGAMSLPREISLSSDGRLLQHPAAEVETLRTENECLQTQLKSETKQLHTKGRALEICITAQFTDTDDFVLNLLQTPDGQEKTRLRFNAHTHMLSLERSLTSLDDKPAKSFQKCTIPPGDNVLRLRVFLDHSIIEIFANDTQTITGRLYPTRDDADGISIEGTVKSLSLDIWRMNAAAFTEYGKAVTA